MHSNMHLPDRNRWLLHLDARLGPHFCLTLPNPASDSLQQLPYADKVLDLLSTFLVWMLHFSMVDMLYGYLTIRN